MLNRSKYNMTGIISVILALIMLFGLFPLLHVVRAEGIDKSNAVYGKSFTVQQNNAEIAFPDGFDVNENFKIQLSFKFNILNNDYAEIFQETDPNILDKQIDNGDFANIILGKNFKYTDPENRNVPVYLIGTGQQVGFIELSNNEQGQAVAKMNFQSNPNDPKGEFEYEPNEQELKEVTVYFEATFAAAKKEASNPPTDDDVIQILDKTFQLPKQEEKEKLTFKKSGEQIDPEKIEWTVDISHLINGENVDLKNYVFTDDLSNVGEFVSGSFKLNEQPIPDADVYDAAQKKVSLTIPENTNSAKITFQTSFTWEGNELEKTIQNTADLVNPEQQSEEQTADVPVSRKPNISKALDKIKVDQENHEKSISWSIYAGKPGYSYGPAWVADVLSSNQENFPKPKRINYTVSRQKADGSYEVVETIDASEREDRPAVSASANDISDFYQDKSAYYLGQDDFAAPTKAAPVAPDHLLQTNWFYIPELTGYYHIQIEHIFAADVNFPAESLKNNAEIHIPQGVFTPVTPPVFGSLVGITKTTPTIESDNSGSEDIRQGIISWDITVDATKSFPVDPQYAYEFFYYGKKEAYEAEKDQLTVNGTLPQKTFEKLKEAKTDDAKTVTFNLAYVDGSLQSADNLEAQVYPVMNGEQQVGEIVQFKNINEIKEYKFSIKTQVQDLLGKSSINLNKLRNTIAFIMGEGDTSEKLTADAYFSAEGKIFDKTALENDLALDDFKKISQDNGDARIDLNENVNPNKVFNYQERTAYFRFDVNPFGLKFNEYQNSLKKTHDFIDFKNLTVKDSLPEGWTLTDIAGSDNKFILYKANPATIYSVKYSTSYPGSAPFNAEIYEPYATKKYSDQEALDILSFDENELSWTFKNYDNATYMILIKAKLSEEKFQELVEQQKQNDTAKLYTNNVNLYAGDKLQAQSKIDVKVKPSLLNKTSPGPLQMNDDGSYQKQWTITYNPYAIGKYQDVELIDTLDENLSIPVNQTGQPDPNMISVLRSKQLLANGQYDFENAETVAVGEKLTADTITATYDAATHQLIFRIPNQEKVPYAYQITYMTNLEPNNLEAEELRNRVIAKAKQQNFGSEGLAVEDLRTNTAWANIKGIPFFVLQKQAADDVTKILPGATFSLYKGDQKIFTKVTNAKGNIYLLNLTEGDYRLVEESAPEGYALAKEPILFSINGREIIVKEASQGLAKGKGLLSDPLAVVNTPKPSEEETTKPSQEQTTSTTVKSTTKPNTERSSAKTESQTTASKIARTGETVFASVLVIVLLVAAVVLIILRRKQKK